MNIDEAQAKVDDLKRSLEAAEEELRQARNEAYQRVVNRPCPECGTLVGLASLPNKEGIPTTVPAQCEGCGRRWELKTTWNGGSTLEPNNYKLAWTWRGWLYDEFPPPSLTNEQLQNLKDYYEDLGEGATPAERERLKALIFEQVRRMDARKLDEIKETSVTILDLLKAKLGCN